VAGWEFYQSQLVELDEKIAKQLQQMKKHQALPPLPPKPRRTRRPNEPRFDVRTALYYVTGVDLTEIEGVDAVTALIVVSEIGTDMTRFATVKHFCSWLGLCPQHKKTGGKIKSSRTRPGVNRAAAALRMGASTLVRSKSALGAFHRRMKSRLGSAQAVVATAHKIARQVYNSLRYGKGYVKQSQEEYEKRMREKQIASLKRRARELGMAVVDVEQTKEGQSITTN
jgi:transposase